MRTKLLTDKEKADLIAFRENIIARATQTAPIDHAKAEKAYNDLLVSMGHSPITNFLWFDSPYDLHSKLRGQLRNQLWGQLRNQLWGQLGDQLGDQLGGQLRDQLRGQLWGQLGDQLGDQLWNQLWGQLRDQLRDQLDQWELQQWMWMEYVAELDEVEVDRAKYERLKLLSTLGEHSFWIIPLKDGAAFCERPVRLVRSVANVMHYDHDAAIEFPDGWKLYCLHGVSFTEEQFKRITSDDMTLGEFAQMGLSNEQRPAALQMLRADRLLEQVNAKLIHIGKRGVELYEVPNFMDTGETEYCLKMEHPSIKGKLYIEWVHPDVGKKGDADEAMASNRHSTKAQYLRALIA